uniref:WWE domain-containing protein n=1 Tax=Amphilophus citrinellus TaxID=61819 RepID=A0A3Q0R173_AMPCI
NYSCFGGLPHCCPSGAPNMLSSSISSRDVEQQFTQNPQGSFTFTVGHTSYSLNFSTMTQSNHITGLQRKVRRRPKLMKVISCFCRLSATLTPPAPSSSQIGVVAYRWEFMGDREQWTEYQAHVCSFDSAAIERHFQFNQQGKLHFRINRHSYTLDFSSMHQVNNDIGTRRAVRRTPTHGIQLNSTQAQWQFLDINGAWTDYSKRKCSISSQEIEFQYQLNPSGTMKFSTSSFSYELSFSAMTQRNLSTGTTRAVRRLNQ